jgi:hypothetical protein
MTLQVTQCAPLKITLRFVSIKSKDLNWEIEQVGKKIYNFNRPNRNK